MTFDSELQEEERFERIKLYFRHVIADKVPSKQINENITINKISRQGQ